MRIKNGFVLREVCGEQVIMGEGVGALDFGKLLCLNETAAWLWQKASEGDFTIESLTEALCDEYEVSAEQAKADVAAIVTAVLKGPANARLYPDPLLRQAGDIDLWVEGGHDSVVALLHEMDFPLSDRCLRSKHHVCLEQDENGILVEIHHKTSSGIFNLFAKKRLLRYLEREILNLEHVPEGFFVPSMKFALMMQLSHIQKHFFDEGVGLKQLTDYYILLRNSSPEDRREVSSKLKSFGLYKGCGAVMWIMEHVFGLSPEMMLVKPDKRRGMTMLAEINEGGNFGLNPRKQTSFFVNWLKRRYRTIRLFSFAPVEAALHELDYWKSFIRYTPLRIKYRKLSVRHLK